MGRGNFPRRRAVQEGGGLCSTAHWIVCGAVVDTPYLVPRFLDELFFREDKCGHVRPEFGKCRTQHKLLLLSTSTSESKTWADMGM